MSNLFDKRVVNWGSVFDMVFFSFKSKEKNFSVLLKNLVSFYLIFLFIYVVKFRPITSFTRGCCKVYHLSLFSLYLYIWYISDYL